MDRSKETEPFEHPTSPPFVPIASGASPAPWTGHGMAGTPPSPSPSWPALGDDPYPGAVVVEEPPRYGAGERRRGLFGGPLGKVWPFLLLALTKLKWLAVLFKFKAFATFWTMLLSVGVYAAVFGLPFAVGIVMLLFVHEMGHAIVLKQQGVKATAPLFIPFMGAVIGMRELPKNVYAEAKMALGGPIAGSLGALACLLLWQATDSPLFIALAYFGCWLNLFNLIPVSPLDGGRAMAALSRWGWIVGLVLLIVLFLRLHSLFLGLILVVGGMEVFKRWRGQQADEVYYATTGRQRLAVAAAYFGLAAVLALAMFALQSHLVINQPAR